jgi:hypothetical protein
MSRVHRFKWMAVSALLVSAAVYAAYPQWSEGTQYTVGAKVSYGGHDYQALQTHTALAGAGWTPPTQPALWMDLGASSGTPSPVPAPAPAPSPSSTIVTTGKINFHLLLGAGNPQDSLTLDGDNFTDLIMSNLIAGVMYGYLVKEYYPGIQFEKDYLYGSVLGQLLQENLETQLYQSSGDQIDPSKDQQAVMAKGQGGPYQINNYAADMISGTYAPAGHSLINYIAIQKSIGYSMNDAAIQYTKVTPPSFNDKYYGPILTAYFHYNDLVALVETGKGDGGWTTPWQPAFDNTMKNFKTLPDNFLEILMNVAYNQGFYGTLMSSYSNEGATATATTVTQVDDWSSVWGRTDSYEQYPYQVRYYLNQFYGRPIPTTSATTLMTPQNHIAFNMTTLGQVFDKVFLKLSYVDATTGEGAFIPEAKIQAAFSSALTQHGVSATSVLDLSNTSDRSTIFAVLEDAIGNLETALGVKFNATTNSQI